MASLKSFIFGQKAVPFMDVLTEETRDALHKAYIPKFLYKPPFGYPRYANLDYVRYLAQTPYVEMCIDTILKQLSAIDWSIVPNDEIPERIADNIYYDEEGKFKPEVEAEINHIKNFLKNPNTNPDEDFESIFIKQAMRDVLEINTGVVIKAFNLKQQMAEIVARDGATFTKNPDIHGMFTYRDDLIIPKQIVQSPGEVVNPFQHIPTPLVTDKAAYFQYGWITGPLPQPFGKREVVWLQNMVRSDDIYGYSPVQLLANSLQMLLYQIESDLEYYNDNNVPKGIIGLDASDTTELNNFKQQWNEIQHKKDSFGNYKKMQHKVPILNYIPKFERVEFSAEEMQLIEKQKWYSKMVWASFGVTASELGYTEDAQGQANQIVQSRVFKRKAINPNLRLLEKRLNKNVIPEFEYTVNIPIGRQGQKVPAPKYKFKFNIFDVEEEQSKADLYEKWVDIGYKTVNEIRELDGLKPVEWGDEKPQRFREQGNSFNFGQSELEQQKPSKENEEGEGSQVAKQTTNKTPKTKEPAQNVNKTKKEMQNQTKSQIEGKPFAGYEDFNACVRDNQDKNDPEAYCAQIHKEATGDWPQEKSMQEENPLILKEGEQPDKKKLIKALKYQLKKNKKALKDAIKQEMREDKIKQIKSELQGLSYDDYANIEVKSLNDVVEKLKSYIDLSVLAPVANAAIKNEFLQGAQKAEQDINKIKPYNYEPNYDAIKYIADYTFDNIKGMDREIENDLRQELQRGFMNGEGTDAITKRVQNVFDSSISRAETIARTETARATQFGKLNAWQSSGVKADKWLMWTNDNRTSDITKALHKKYGSPEKAIPMEENFKLTIQQGKKTITIDQPAGPFHPNERDELIITPRENT